MPLAYTQQIQFTAQARLTQRCTGKCSRANSDLSKTVFTRQLCCASADVTCAQPRSGDLPSQLHTPKRLSALHLPSGRCFCLFRFGSPDPPLCMPLMKQKVDPRRLHTTLMQVDSRVAQGVSSPAAPVPLQVLSPNIVRFAALTGCNIHKHTCAGCAVTAKRKNSQSCSGSQSAIRLQVHLQKGQVLFAC